MATSERLYVVQWSDDGRSWSVVKDETADRLVPAAYDTAGEAETRREDMADQFPEVHYRVVGFEHHRHYAPVGGEDNG